MTERRPPAPKPANFEAMAAAWDNPAEFARQKAIYTAQLVDAGCAPSWPDLFQFDERVPERFDDRADLQ